MKWHVLFLSGLVVCSNAFAREHVVTSCPLGNTRMQLLRSQPIYDSYQYAIRTAKAASTPIFGDEEYSRGSSVVGLCLGQKHRILILSGEFTANAMEGVAYFHEKRVNRLASLRFSERTRPRWAYIGPSDLQLVFVNGDHGESDSKYTIYRYQRDLEPSVRYSNVRPSGRELQVISIQRAR